jgi:acyl dehydratase
MTEQEGSPSGDVGALTKEAVEEYLHKVGRHFTTTSGSRHACEDLISRFADALGDPNPLWRDQEYARKAPYSSIVAPPYFLSVAPSYELSPVPGGRLAQGPRGVDTFLAGHSWEFYKPVLPGDRITSDLVFAGLEEKSGGFAPYWLLEHYDSRYYNQRRELVSFCRGSMGWAEVKYIGRGSAGQQRTEKKEERNKEGGGKLQLPHPWTLEELTQIEDEMMAEPIRGSVPRYWEEVQQGEDLPTLTKGPLRIADMIIWTVVATPWPAFAPGIKELRERPGTPFIHPDSHAREEGILVHIDKITAQKFGFPQAYGFSRQELGWFSQQLTDWVGDDGWLKKFSGQYRRFIYISDVNRFHSRVVEKYVDDHGEACVDIESTAINQRGEKTLVGNATVILPSRERGINPVDKRLAGR